MVRFVLSPAGKNPGKGSHINLEDVYNRAEKDLCKITGNDPVEFVHRYHEKEDIEIAGFLASQFAYGSIKVFRRFLEDLFGRMGSHPGAFVTAGDFSGFGGLYYRFQKEDDLYLLFGCLKNIMDGFGGIGAMVEQYYRGDVREMIFNIRRWLFREDDKRLTFFFPRPSNVNPLKRWNLYLRWMVRKDDIDRGLWQFIDKGSLTIPLDTHLFKIGRCLGWTKRNSQSWGAAREITEALKKFSADDPLKYDFFLCHRVGIAAGCTGKRQSKCKEACLIHEV